MREKRIGLDRRSGVDRRSGIERRTYAVGGYYSPQRKLLDRRGGERRREHRRSESSMGTV
ncbi:MAG: hypothetical protein CO150_03510 [Nitrospirae bacterium CG_4_9_14_3_um_filter_53_35]|nr:MAG: hypothetical protein AUK29_02625 [Nitrospirae bacterium CG2_30_53_67]PIS36116.1 MAG: hypothetical protein COT35_12885 [Nitrospirae bacterium CG08_land_8_20_14_0_20_52_24]PIV83179.1 MAG: hypothetical protein COW52_09675 [Nitrospirae bacterium CG17_big_fil_post_rev_8_21_14_2_50_50_9]PIW85036.1 MAG: hypothetical protein COZ95_06690 [Nitrospirae bacterium CG_4_8_14_3_um_filter_50_41]PIX86962.1 MAG: hypothetical protein COZ32_00625 [Nitrospirae bacterium CG_4_10_14_3_um_filter_53_41]PJA7628